MPVATVKGATSHGRSVRWPQCRAPSAGPERASRPGQPKPFAERDWIDVLAALDECDGYVVLMIDPKTAEVDTQGPLGGPAAVVAGDALRTSLDAEDLADVIVNIVRLQMPTQTQTILHHHRAVASPRRRTTGCDEAGSGGGVR